MMKSLAPIYIDIEDYSDPLKIGGITLRRITEKERELIFGIKNIKKKGKGFSYTQTDSSKYIVKEKLNFQHMLFVDYILEYETSKTSKQNNFFLEKNIRDLLLSFNLFGEGRVDSPIVISMETTYDMQTRVRTGEKYMLKSGDIGNVEEIFCLVRDNENEKLKLLLERFRGTYFANLRRENIFIELMSIVESLLDVGNAELSYRLSLYASYLLTNKCSFPVSFERIKTFYNLRSKLIHKGVLNKELEEKDLVELRRCTARLLLLGLKDFKQIVNIELDIKKELNI